MGEQFTTLDNLARLPDDERVALMGLAGVGLPASNSHLARLLAGLGRFPQAPAWAENPRRLQEVLAGLQARGLAGSPRPGYWACTGRSLESAARMAFAEGILGRLHRSAVAASGFGTVVPDAFLRLRGELRLALLEGGPQRWLTAREQFAAHFGKALGHRDPLCLVCAGPFEPGWFETLPAPAQAYGCQALLYAALLHGDRDPAFLPWLEARAEAPRSGPAALPVLVHLAFQGRRPDLERWLAVQGPDLRASPVWPSVEAMAALAGGDPAGAVGRFSESLARLRQTAQARNLQADPVLPGPFEPCHVLALVAVGDLDLARARVALLARRDRDDPLAAAAVPLDSLVRTRAGAAPEGLAWDRPGPRIPPYARFLDLLGAHLEGLPVPPDLTGRVRRACAALPLGWFARELEELEARQGGRPPRPSPLLDLAPRGEPWERALERLRQLGQPGSPAQRLAWYLSPGPDGACALEARAQDRDPGGAWSAGTTVTWAQLRAGARIRDDLSAQDRRVIACLGANPDPAEDPGGDLPGALAALAGHAFLFRTEGDRALPVDLLHGQPELCLRARGRTLEVSLEPPPAPAGYRVLAEAPDRLRLYVFTDLHRRLGDLLGRRLVVPAAARERLLRVLGALAPLVPVRTEPGAAGDRPLELPGSGAAEP